MQAFPHMPDCAKCKATIEVPCYATPSSRGHALESLLAGGGVGGALHWPTALGAFCPREGPRQGASSLLPTLFNFPKAMQFLFIEFMNTICFLLPIHYFFYVLFFLFRTGTLPHMRLSGCGFCSMLQGKAACCSIL